MALQFLKANKNSFVFCSFLDKGYNLIFSFGESGKTNSPILGVSLTDTETRIQILADSQLNENEEIQMIFKNFLPVDGPFESIRRDLFPGESQTIRQGSMECSFLAESPRSVTDYYFSLFFLIISKVYGSACIRNKQRVSFFLFYVP